MTAPPDIPKSREAKPYNPYAWLSLSGFSYINGIHLIYIRSSGLLYKEYCFIYKKSRMEMLP